MEGVELARCLLRELRDKAIKTKRGKEAPNYYTIALSKNDYERLCAARIKEGLLGEIEKALILQDMFMEGRLRLNLVKDNDLPVGKAVVTGSFTAEDWQEEATVVLTKEDFAPLNLPPEIKTVSLTVIEGRDLDAYLEFGEKPVYIGRREHNDFILTDDKTSRVHAYINYESHRHVIYDAQSLNGTFLNGEAIKSRVLSAGDEIKVGDTILLYEVI